MLKILLHFIPGEIIFFMIGCARNPWIYLLIYKPMEMEPWTSQGGRIFLFGLITWWHLCTNYPNFYKCMQNIICMQSFEISVSSEWSITNRTCVNCFVSVENKRPTFCCDTVLGDKVCYQGNSWVNEQDNMARYLKGKFIPVLTFLPFQVSKTAGLS